MNEKIEINKANYYSIIPSTVRYNKNLKYAARLMYGEITALCNVKGYCYATNKYFAKLYDVSIETISRWISDLAKYNYIKVEIIRDDNKKVLERRIYILDNPYQQKEANICNIKNKFDGNTSYQNNQYPYCQNDQYSIDEKIKENNINKNIINTHIGKKIQYADNVYLFEYEYQDLVAEIGKDKADECIKELSLYKKSKGVNYKDDLSTIKRWVISRVEELHNKKEKQKNQHKFENKSNYTQRKYSDKELNSLYANFNGVYEN